MKNLTFIQLITDFLQRNVLPSTWKSEFPQNVHLKTDYSILYFYVKGILGMMSNTKNEELQKKKVHQNL